MVEDVRKGRCNSAVYLISRAPVRIFREPYLHLYSAVHSVEMTRSREHKDICCKRKCEVYKRQPEDTLSLPVTLFLPVPKIYSSYKEETSDADDAALVLVGRIDKTKSGEDVVGDGSPASMDSSDERLICQQQSQYCVDVVCRCHYVARGTHVADYREHANTCSRDCKHLYRSVCEHIPDEKKYRHVDSRIQHLPHPERDAVKEECHAVTQELAYMEVAVPNVFEDIAEVDSEVEVILVVGDEIHRLVDHEDDEGKDC